MRGEEAKATEEMGSLFSSVAGGEAFASELETSSIKVFHLLDGCSTLMNSNNPTNW